MTAQYDRDAECKSCYGTGDESGAWRDYPCPACGGSGVAHIDRSGDE